MLSKKYIHCSPNSLLKDYLIPKAISTSGLAVSDWFAVWAISSRLNCASWLVHESFIGFIDFIGTGFQNCLSSPCLDSLVLWSQWSAGSAVTSGGLHHRPVLWRPQEFSNRFLHQEDTVRGKRNERCWPHDGKAHNAYTVCSHTLTWVLRDQHMLPEIICPGY